ncbi:uncharacterized protein DUF4145 [Rhodoglobus vestalii]|uniref:Uncharacterized protein DUF4145 n=1 Tax=Rhodoglobus vestalii TaxID=193384 RepID=A0A8H2PUW8_9MICO|nr:DUF4145 domain-containing protein [Rhodoglobus vestalii]TQO20991.1 uncharacterized protein DUF4145 [Rhodoglobus vestalii]
MADAISDLTIISGAPGNFSKSDNRAFVLGECPNCAGTQLILLGYKTISSPITRWLRCANCEHGLVQNGSKTSPSTLPLRVPKGVSGGELELWNEIRECLGGGTTTAAVMLCRKLLLHIAVSQGLHEKGENGRSPNFLQAVNHLESEGVITKKMRVWVDRIKDVGNEANHVIASVSKAQAMDVAEFTEQLLRLTYEMDYLIEKRAEPEE